MQSQKQRKTLYQSKHPARNALTWLLILLFLLQPNAAISFSTFAYDTNDNVLTETNALGKTTIYTYDGVDNRTSVTDALGNRSEFTYNSLGRVLTAKDALNNTTSNTYDANGRVLKTKDAQNNETNYIYSLQTGQLTSTTDALSNVTRFEYPNGYLTKKPTHRAMKRHSATTQTAIETPKRSNEQMPRVSLKRSRHCLNSML